MQEARTFEDPTAAPEAEPSRAHIYVRTQVVGSPAQMAAITAAMQTLKTVVEEAGGDLSKGSLTIEEPPKDEPAKPERPDAEPKAAAQGWPALGRPPQPTHPIAEPGPGNRREPPPHAEPR